MSWIRAVFSAVVLVIIIGTLVTLVGFGIITILRVFGPIWYMGIGLACVIFGVTLYIHHMENK
jgi:hypothetical protein